MSNVQKDLRLLPHSFMKVGLGIMLLSFLLIILSVSDVITADKEQMKTISKSVFLLSLLLLSITSSKVEDELTLRIRLKAYAISFIFGVVIVIIDPLINLMFEGSLLSNMGVAELLISMFFQYFFWLFIMRKFS